MADVIRFAKGIDPPEYFIRVVMPGLALPVEKVLPR